jgi:hypothetical protein
MVKIKGLVSERKSERKSEKAKRARTDDGVGGREDEEVGLRSAGIRKRIK